jgi:hypothetical protein
VAEADVRWQRDDRTLFRAAPGVVVLLGPDGGDPIALRGTGVALWEVLDLPHRTEELATRLAADFGSDTATVRSDIEPVIAELAAVGALRPGS